MEATLGADRTATKADLVQFLTFSLAGEEYGLPILRVKEIKGHSGFTPIPSSPAWVKGVMNLRGTVVPVYDLRARLGVAAAECAGLSVVIVVNVADKIAGLLVDSVSEVVSVPANAIEMPPDLDGGSGFITGLFRSNERFVAVLGVEHICGVTSSSTTSAPAQAH